jgi:hypothetical protein
MTTMRQTQSRLRRHPWLLPAGLGAGVLVDVTFDPIHRHVPMCPFKAITGWDCPLCGGLRAVDQFAHGHVTAALHANVLVMTGGPLLVLAYLIGVRRPDRKPVPRWLIYAGAALAVAFTVVRNLPPMHALRPS